jgi:hypothetical protein
LNKLEGIFKDYSVIIKANNIIKILLLIIFFGVALRYYGIYNAENTDEYNEVIEALRVGSGKFNYERWWKKGYQNILAVEYGIYYVVGYTFGKFDSPMDFADKIVSDMNPLFVIGRYTTATLGILSILLLYVIGSKIYNKKIGLIASFLLTINSIHVWTSHLVNTDIPLLFFFLLSFYFVVQFYMSGKRIHYILAAFFGAFAINMKVLGVGIAVIFILAHIMRSKEEGKGLKSYLFNYEILFSLIAFLIGFIISNPPIIFGFKQFIDFHFNVYSNTFNEVPYAEGSNAFFEYIILSIRELGVPLFLIVIAGLVCALIRRSNWDIILFVFIIIMFTILSGTSFLVQNRYLMILFPGLYLLAGRFIEFSLNSMKFYNRKLMILFALLLIAFPAYNSLKYVISLTNPNTSKVSEQWIEENIPAGSKLLIDAGKTIITFGPRLNQSKENLEKKLNLIKNLKDGQTYDSPLVKIVDSYSSIYFELLLKNIPQITYDITSTELGRNVESVKYYRENGFQYYIHNEGLSFRYNDSIWRDKYQKSVEFYDSFRNEYELIKSFTPSITRSGSSIEIYKIN